MVSFETEFDSKGFVAGVFRGTRSFLIDTDGNLTGIFYKQVWDPAVNDATCLKGTVPTFYPYYPSPPPPPPATPPEPIGPHGMAVCRHGFYGYYAASNDYYSPGRVSGVIEGWGDEVMVGTRGFRCMKARIVALCMSEVVVAERDRVALVLERYSTIPMFNTFDQMVSEFPPDEGEF